MKNIVIAAMLAALGSTCLAETNTSQVSVYGRFDAGIDYLHGVRAADGRPASRWAVQSGDWGASWLGFKGREDLGGGDAIVFALETGLNLVKGTVTGSAASGNAFSRVATVGLQSQRYGTLRLGRDLLLSNGQWDMDPMMNELSSGNTLMRSRNALIANNLLQY